MAARRKSNPFRGVIDIMGEMSRLSDQMTGTDSGAGNQHRGYADAWTPTTDVLAAGNDLVIRVELPGILSENVEVGFSNSMLAIFGERPTPADGEDAQYYVNERLWGRFRRSIALPEDVGEDQISARFEEGLLEVIVRGAAAARGPKAIQIESSRKRRG